MPRLCRWSRLLLPAALVALGVGQAAAQAGTVSTARVISLAAVKQTKITLTVTSGVVQTLPNFTDNTTNNFPAPVILQSQWDLHPGQTNTVTIVGWFSTPAQALVAGAGAQIPSSRIKGKVTPGATAAAWPATFTAFTSNAVAGLGTAGGSLRLLQVSISGANKTTTRTDQLDLQLDLTGAGTLPPGTYSGTLNIQAITQ
jgi:hypothetical protein